jgi:hypothetical protein
LERLVRRGVNASCFVHDFLATTQPIQTVYNILLRRSFFCCSVSL